MVSNHFRAARKDGFVGVLFANNCGSSRVKTSISMGTGKSYLVKDDDGIIITFRFFSTWRRPYLGKIEKNWNRHRHTLESLVTAITTIQLLIGMWFSAVHPIVATWNSVKPVVLFSWFEGPSPKRTMMKVFETSPRSSHLPLSWN